MHLFPTATTSSASAPITSPLVPSNDEAVSVRGKVVVTEFSGSESVIHMSVGGDNWVSLSHGIHPLKRGEAVELFVQADHCFYFDENEQIIG